MTDLSQLNGRQLDAAISEAMGARIEWHTFFIGSDNAYRTSYEEESGSKEPFADGDAGAIPSFSTSLDALSAGPERVLREAGWVSSHQDYTDDWQEWSWEPPADEMESEFGSAGTMAEPIRARACLAALTALKGNETYLRAFAST